MIRTDFSLTSSVTVLSRRDVNLTTSEGKMKRSFVMRTELFDGIFLITDLTINSENWDLTPSSSDQWRNEVNFSQSSSSSAFRIDLEALFLGPFETDGNP